MEFIHQIIRQYMLNLRYLRIKDVSLKRNRVSLALRKGQDLHQITGELASNPQLSRSLLRLKKLPEILIFYLAIPTSGY